MEFGVYYLISILLCILLGLVLLLEGYLFKVLQKKVKFLTSSNDRRYVQYEKKIKIFTYLRIIFFLFALLAIISPVLLPTTNENEDDLSLPLNISTNSPFTQSPTISPSVTLIASANPSVQPTKTPIEFPTTVSPSNSPIICPTDAINFTGQDDFTVFCANQPFKIEFNVFDRVTICLEAEVDFVELRCDKILVGNSGNGVLQDEQVINVCDCPGIGIFS